MKKIIAFALIAAGVLVLTACHSEDDSPEHLTGGGAGAPRARKAGPQAFIAGTYVATEHTLYSQVADTLVITKRKNTGSIYDISRYTCFSCQLLQQTIATKYATQRWLASFDDRANLLFIIGKDFRLQYLPRENAVQLHGISFQKIE